jgi:hypothetical protein
MEGSGKFGHGAGNGPRGTGSAGFHGQAQGQAYTRQGYQRYGATGFHGNRGGGRRYDQRGRGFKGNFRQTEFRPSLGDQCQPNATSRDMEVNLHGQGTVHGNAMQRNQYVEVHGQRPYRRGQEWTNPVGGSSSGDGGNTKTQDLASILAGMLSLFQ